MDGRGSLEQLFRLHAVVDGYFGMAKQCLAHTRINKIGLFAGFYLRVGILVWMAWNTRNTAVYGVHPKTLYESREVL